MGTREGIGDRLRAAAFAELQAIHGFRWAADRFTQEVSAELRLDWLRLAQEEEKHMNWLLARLEGLGIPLRERPVSDFLWRSFLTCTSARAFCHYIAGAEERGRDAGLRFAKRMQQFDPISAEIFGQIAEEEKSHIELAYRYFPLSTRPFDLANQTPMRAAATAVSPTDSPIQAPNDSSFALPKHR